MQFVADDKHKSSFIKQTVYETFLEYLHNFNVGTIAGTENIKLIFNVHSSILPSKAGSTKTAHESISDHFKPWL
jgi:hypothetical protein